MIFLGNVFDIQIEISVLTCSFIKNLCSKIGHLSLLHCLTKNRKYIFFLSKIVQFENITWRKIVAE